MIKKNLFLFLYTFVLLLLLTQLLLAQARVRYSINSNWQFLKGDTSTYSHHSWTSVSLPHSYNVSDVMDDSSGYYRGNAWYKRKVYVPPSLREKSVYLFFEGVNQTAAVFVNGKLAGEHVGGYTAFRVPVSKFLKTDSDENQILVKVNNAFNEDIPPLTADFTFFGGMYRDVFLEAFDAIHFRKDNYSSDGVFISTPGVSENSANLRIEGEIANQTSFKHTVSVRAALFDSLGKQIVETKHILPVAAAMNQAFRLKDLVVSKPILWSPSRPYLYTLQIQLLDAKSGKTLDLITKPVGFRWFSFTAEKGFFLNGKRLKLWGTSRHQDYPGLGNALPNELHVSDVELLKEMGANFLRVAHYPQDPAILEACDRLGILTSVEIPVVNTITESARFKRNSVEMLIEMIRQNYNHPSIVMWATMNEVLLRPLFGDNKQRQEIYFNHVTAHAKALDSVSRAEDPDRFTMMAFHGNYDLYKRTGLLDIPMVAGWNLYQGWYSGDITGFGKFLDMFHQNYPQKAVLVTEYGADGDPRIRSLSPERFDKSVEYENYFHKVYFREIAARDFVSGGLVWNLADFNSATREETMPHINNKGLLDWSREPKDTYYLYQAFLKKKPFLKIGSSSWNKRAGVADSATRSCTQPVEVYTNLSAPVTLYNNGMAVGTGTAMESVVAFNVPFSTGRNQLEVRADSLADFAAIDFEVIPRVLRDSKVPFYELNVSLGDTRYFVDKEHQITWLPERRYEKGRWGYAGGEIFRMKDRSRQPFGSDKNITGTDRDPVYATQRINIQSFIADVPDGVYSITLHFAELLGGEKKEALAYNLSASENSIEEAHSRSFHVIVNGEKVLDGISSGKELEPLQAFSVTIQKVVLNNEGLSINFEPITGVPILNAIQIHKIY